MVDQSTSAQSFADIRALFDLRRTGIRRDLRADRRLPSCMYQATLANASKSVVILILHKHISSTNRKGCADVEIGRDVGDRAAARRERVVAVRQSARSRDAFAVSATGVRAASRVGTVSRRQLVRAVCVAYDSSRRDFVRTATGVGCRRQRVCDRFAAVSERR